MIQIYLQYKIKHVNWTASRTTILMQHNNLEYSTQDPKNWRKLRSAVEAVAAAEKRLSKHSNVWREMDQVWRESRLWCLVSKEGFFFPFLSKCLVIAMLKIDKLFISNLIGNERRKRVIMSVKRVNGNCWIKNLKWCFIKMQKSKPQSKIRSKICPKLV